MVGLGTGILTLLYFATGGFVGEWARRCFDGRGSEILENYRLFYFALGLNVAAIGCLILLRRRTKSESPMQEMERPWEVIVRGFPLTNRVAFLLFGTAYAIGAVVGVLFA